MGQTPTPQQVKGIAVKEPGWVELPRKTRQLEKCRHRSRMFESEE